MKVIKSLENSGTAWKITSQEGGFFNFLKPLNDNWFTINKECNYVSYVSATDATIQKKTHGSGITALMSSNESMKDIVKMVKSGRNRTTNKMN